MTIEEQKLKNLFKKRNASQSGWIDVFPAKLGKADGTILTDTVGIIYVRHVVNGQVYEVYNDGAPTDKFGLQVEVGRRIGEKELRIKSVRGVYNQPANPAVNVNTLLSELFIGRDRFLPFLVFPINGGGLVVNIYGDVFLKSDGTFGYVANQTLDLTPYVPASGAKFVLIEADDSGVIYVTAGTAVDSKELLTPANIPAVTTGRIPSTAVRLYTGQTQLYRDPNSINDFVDVRSITAGGGGGGASIPVLTSDPASPSDGQLWLLRQTTGAHADGEIMGALAMTYQGDTGAAQPLELSVNDNGTTRRIQFS